MRRKHPFPDQSAGPSKWYTESQFIAQCHRSVGSIYKAVVVFEAGKSSGDHAVAKEHHRLETLDQALVELGEP